MSRSKTTPKDQPTQYSVPPDTHFFFCLSFSHFALSNAPTEPCRDIKQNHGSASGRRRASRSAGLLRRGQQPTNHPDDEDRVGRNGSLPIFSISGEVAPLPRAALRRRSRRL